MSISAVGGVSSAQSQAATANAKKPESSEVPGAPDHDNDADNRATTGSAAKVSGLAAGTVNVKA